MAIGGRSLWLQEAHGSLGLKFLVYSRKSSWNTPTKAKDYIPQHARLYLFAHADLFRSNGHLKLPLFPFLGANSISRDALRRSAFPLTSPPRQGLPGVVVLFDSIVRFLERETVSARTTFPGRPFDWGFLPSSFFPLCPLLRAPVPEMGRGREEGGRRSSSSSSSSFLRLLRR